MRFLVVLGALALLTAAAVLFAMRSFDAGDGRLRAIDANLASLGKVVWQTGDGHECTAYFQQAVLQLIEESPLARNNPQQRYYYLDGKLIGYRRLVDGEVSDQFLVSRKNRLYRTRVGGAAADFPQQRYRQTLARAEQRKQEAESRAGAHISLPLLRAR